MEPEEIEGTDPQQLEDAATAIEVLIAAALAAVAAQAATSMVVVPGIPAVDINVLGSIPQWWEQRLRRRIMPALRRTVDTVTRRLRGLFDTELERLGETEVLYTGTGMPELFPADDVGPVGPLPDITAEDILAQARNRLVAIGDDLWVNARASLVEGMQQGESVPQLAARVRAAAGVTEPRARVIARTEVISASNAASIAQARSTGIGLDKIWIATEDPRTRVTHRDADGQTVPIDTEFTVGGEALDFPGDPTGRADNVINCRCSIGYRMNTPTVAAATPTLDTREYVRDGDGQFAETPGGDDDDVFPAAFELIESAKVKGRSIFGPYNVASFTDTDGAYGPEGGTVVAVTGDERPNWAKTEHPGDEARIVVPAQDVESLAARMDDFARQLEPWRGNTDGDEDVGPERLFSDTLSRIKMAGFRDPFGDLYQEGGTFVVVGGLDWDDNSQSESFESTDIPEITAAMRRLAADLPTTAAAVPHLHTCQDGPRPWKPGPCKGWKHNLPETDPRWKPRPEPKPARKSRAKKAVTPEVPAEPDVADTVIKQRQERQKTIDQARGRAGVLAELEQLALMEGASPRLYTQRLNARIRKDGLGEDPVVSTVADAVRTGDAQQIMAAIEEAARKAGLERIGGAPGNPDQVMPFDRTVHRPTGGDIPDGAPAQVVRPGYRYRMRGEGTLVLEKALVEHLPQPEKDVLDLPAISDISAIAALDSSGPQDEKLKAIMQLRNFDDLPTIASPNDIDRAIAAGYTELFRGVSTTEQAEQFRHGELFVGKGTRGSGIYATSDQSLAAEYGRPEATLRMALRPDARRISIEELANISATNWPDWTSDEQTVYGDPGRLAAALGYDVIAPTDEQIRNGAANFTVLNRTALLVEGDPVDTQMTTASTRPPLDTRDYVRDNDGQFADIPGVGNDAPKGGRVGDAANARAAASPDKLKLSRKVPEGVTVRSSARLAADDLLSVMTADVDTPDGRQLRVGGVFDEDRKKWGAGFDSPQVAERRAEIEREIAEIEELDDDEFSDDDLEAMENLQEELEELSGPDDETMPTAVLRPESRAEFDAGFARFAELVKANKLQREAEGREFDRIAERRQELMEEFGDPDTEETLDQLKRQFQQAQTKRMQAGGFSDPARADEERARWDRNLARLQADLDELEVQRFEEFTHEAKEEWDALAAREAELQVDDVDGLLDSFTVEGVDGSGIVAELYGSDWEGPDDSWSDINLYFRPRNPKPDWKEEAYNGDVRSKFQGGDTRKLMKILGGAGITTAAVGAPNLFEYWVHGEGAAKIQWKVKGAFNRCVEQLDNYSEGDTEFDPEGLCARYYRAATGRWPGEKKGKDDTAMMEVLEDTGCVPCQLAPKPGEMWHAVAHIEGVSTGQRVWQPGSLSWREPPFAFHWEYSSSAHGGQPMTTHVGMVTRIARVGDEIHAWGNLDLANKDGAEVGRKLADGFIRGVSMGPGREKIVYDQVWPEGLTAAQMMTAEPEQWVFTDYMIGELTAVSVPAQAGAYVEPTDELLAALGKQRQIIPELTVAAGAPLLDIPHRPELNCCLDPLHPGPCKGWKGNRQTPSVAPARKSSAGRGKTPQQARERLENAEEMFGSDRSKWTPKQRRDAEALEKVAAKRRESRRGSVEKRTPKQVSNDLVDLAFAQEAPTRQAVNDMRDELGGMTMSELREVAERSDIQVRARTRREMVDKIVDQALGARIGRMPSSDPFGLRGDIGRRTALGVDPITVAGAGSTWTVEVTDLPPADAFVKDFPPGTPPTITPDGRFYGYFAPGNTAHRGSWRQGVRKTAKQQGKTDYSRWLKEIPVAGGGTVLAGPITSNCMHAPTQGYGTLDRRHQFYEDVCSIVAKAAVGEDPDGARWFAGVLVPWITAQQIDQLLMCNLSLDTQPHAERAGWLDFVGVLAVPMGAWPMSTEGTGRIVTRVQEHDGLEVVTASSAPISFLAEPTIPDEVMWQLAGVDPATVMYDNQLVNAALKGAQL